MRKRYEISTVVFLLIRDMSCVMLEMESINEYNKKLQWVASRILVSYCSMPAQFSWAIHKWKHLYGTVEVKNLNGSLVAINVYPLRDQKQWFHVF